MSNAVRYDSLLLRALATELDARLRGTRVARVHFVRAPRTLLIMAGLRRQPLTLSWDLQPAAGHVLLAEGAATPTGALLQVPPGAPVAAVHALPDERIVRIELAIGEAAPGIVRALVVELIGTRWNGLALGRDDVIMAVLVARPDDPRQLQPGVRYAPPPARPRLGTDTMPERAQWHAVLAPVAATDRARALLAKFAYTSPLNAAWILGDATLPETGGHLLDEAYQRYVQLLTAPPQPSLLHGVQPYPHPLSVTDVRLPTLLAAFAAAAQGAAATLPSADTARRELLLARLHDRRQRLDARREKLVRGVQGASAEAAALRAQADLLLAHLRDVPRGAAEVELSDFEGRAVRLRLDPARPPQAVAQEWYEQARRRDRAARRLPAVLQRTDAELRRLAAFRERVEAGQAEGAELAEWLRRVGRAADASSLPYRSYHSSGGLEVRVGRNARANDALTREHAAPEDIWLHARDVGGAHVVLRWGRRDQNPPHPDLVEAAVLAALHSRARTSGVVPVDWTRRKYVRKPRKAPPGQVVLERARTLFVTPDPALEQRLRVAEPGE